VTSDAAIDAPLVDQYLQVVNVHAQVAQHVDVRFQAPERVPAARRPLYPWPPVAVPPHVVPASSEGTDAGQELLPLLDDRLVTPCAVVAWVPFGQIQADQSYLVLARFVDGSQGEGIESEEARVAIALGLVRQLIQAACGPHSPPSREVVTHKVYATLIPSGKVGGLMVVVPEPHHHHLCLWEDGCVKWRVNYFDPARSASELGLMCLNHL